VRGCPCGGPRARALAATVAVGHGPPATHPREHAVSGAEATSPAPMPSRMPQPTTMRAHGPPATARYMRPAVAPGRAVPPTGLAVGAGRERSRPMGPGRPGACGAGSAAPLDASGQVPRMPGPATHLRTRWRVVTANPAHPGSPVGLGHAFRRPGRPPPSPRIAQMAPSRGPQGPSPPPASGHPWEPGPLAPGARRHGDAVARPLRRHEPVPVPCQGPLARGAAASLGDSLSPPGSRMRLPAASSPPPLACPLLGDPSGPAVPEGPVARGPAAGPGPCGAPSDALLGTGLARPPAVPGGLEAALLSVLPGETVPVPRLRPLDLACAHRHLAAPIRWRWWVGNCPEDIRCQSLPSPRPPKDYSSCQWRPTAAGRSRRRRPGRPPAGRGPGAGASSAARQGGRASPARGRPGCV
jgi:hypothetical protein